MVVGMFRKMKVFCLAMALTVTLGMFAGAGASVYASEQSSELILEQEKYQQVSPAKLAQLFSAFEAIPDSVLASEDFNEANSYLNAFIEPKDVARGWWQCSLAVAGLVVTTAVPIAKLAKIKKLVKALGGGVQAAKIIFGASLASEKWAALGGAAKDLVLELTGITSVKQACFG